MDFLAAERFGAAFRAERRAPVDARFPAADAVALRAGFRAAADFFAFPLLRPAGDFARVDADGLPFAADDFARAEAVAFFFAVPAGFLAAEPRFAALEERFF